MSAEEKKQSGQQDVKLADNIAGAEFSNVMQVFHNKEEFRMMFAHVFEPTGKVVGKITMTPAHFKRMVVALQENLERYEREVGKIDEGDAPSGKIGFSEGKE